MGQYQYTTGSGKNSHTTYETVYALNLPHPTAADFILSPQNKLLGFFEHPKIATESIDFNKYFRITYKGDRGSVGADIFQVLTPPAQEHLLAFRKATSAFTLLFRGNCMLVSFPGSLSLKYTNFFRKVALDPRDENALTTKLENILQLASEILPCID
jgi:hypothetical protein